MLTNNWYIWLHSWFFFHLILNPILGYFLIISMLRFDTKLLNLKLIFYKWFVTKSSCFFDLFSFGFFLFLFFALLLFPHSFDPEFVFKNYPSRKKKPTTTTTNELIPTYKQIKIRNQTIHTNELIYVYRTKNEISKKKTQ